MAAGVQQHDGACGRGLERGQHAVKIDTALGGVVIRIAVNSKARAGEDGAVVFPARVADEYGGIGADFFQKIGADFQATRAAYGLHGGYATVFQHLAIGAKHQVFDALVVGGQAVNRQIATGLGVG